MALFAQIDATEAGVRSFLRDSLGLDVQVLAERRLTSLGMTAWKTARIQRSDEAKLEAEEHVNGIKTALQRTDQNSAPAYEKLFT